MNMYIDKKKRQVKLSPVTIAMVGARGVGKTSLLASMGNAIAEITRQTHFSFGPNPAGDTQRIMNDRLLELKQLSRGASLNVAPGGIAGSVVKQEYEFEIRSSLGDVFDELVLPLNFIDFPGGWFRGEDGMGGEVQSTLKQADASVIAIDAPAMMAGRDKDDLINRPEDIVSLYNEIKIGLESKKSRDEDHTVILVLIRADEFLHKGRLEEMYQKVAERYRKLIDLLHSRHINVFCTAVETIGNVEFSFYNRGSDGSPKPEFVRLTTKEFSPNNCDVPLRLVAAHSLISTLKFASEHCENYGAWETLKDLLGSSDLEIRRATYNEVLRILQVMSKSIPETKYKQL